MDLPNVTLVIYSDENDGSETLRVDMYSFYTVREAFQFIPKLKSATTVSITVTKDNDPTYKRTLFY